MSLTKDDAVRRVYMGDSISPTRKEYIDGGIRRALVEQQQHMSAQGDTTRAGRYQRAIEQLDEDFGLDAAMAQALTSSNRRPAGRLVKPRAFLIGYTTVNMQGAVDYLEYTYQDEFRQVMNDAARDGVEAGEALVSFYAKLCYKSLVVGENANISQVRDIKGNIAGTQAQAHGSVFEHISLNFVVTDCSRVYTHEQVRHRVGTAYSQTSGRYCRIEPGKLAVVWDPILDGCEDLAHSLIGKIERTVYLMECRKGLRKPPFGLTDDDIRPESWFDHGIAEIAIGAKIFPARNAMPPDVRTRLESLTTDGDYYPQLTDVDKEWLRSLSMWVPIGKGEGNLAFKKKLTSAIRRFAPNGQTNEMGMTLNVRTLRHVIMMRTSRYSEWEIRVIFNEVYRLAKEKWPLMFADAKEREVDGLLEIYGMKMNPYEQKIHDYTDNELWVELWKRGVIDARLEPLEQERKQQVDAELLREMSRRKLIVRGPGGEPMLAEGVDQAFLAAKHTGAEVPMEQATGGDVVQVGGEPEKGSGAEELPPEETGETGKEPEKTDE